MSEKDHNEEAIESETYTVKYIRHLESGGFEKKLSRDELIELLRDKQNMLYWIELDIEKRS